MDLTIFGDAAMTADDMQNVLSTLAVVFSLVALYVTVAQNRLTRRQDLTATIAELAKIQIAALELQANRQYTTEEGVSMRRVYSLQRRFYAELSSRLIGKLPERQVTEIDHNLLATAYNESSNPVMAEQHWISSVEKSKRDSSRHATNLRGLARFYFRQGRFDEGRQRYKESLEVPLPGDYDGFRRLRSDTCRMWAKEEIEAGFVERGGHLVDAALEELANIKHVAQREQQRAYVELLREMVDSARPTNTVASDAAS